ncbi:MAG: Hsp70 family protein [Polyangiaceae bacterium]
MIVGIDLGTTHTVAAFGEAQSGDIEIVSIPQLVSRGVIESRALLPSVLYAPLQSESLTDPFAPPPFIEGELARLRAAEIPGRAVTSAKSWLSHAGVDRNAPILPWGGAIEGDTTLPKISPVDASARYLARVKRSLDEAKIKPDSVVLTVPASFDEFARELTLDAATRVGLHVRLLEEPQAAFYDVMRRIGESGLNDLLTRTNGEARILVCDVGGGTTDLSLLEVSRPGDEHEIVIDRVAVGRHLLLGGDNMDLALATLAESRFGQKLDATRFSQLVVACRNAKEELLSPSPPDKILVRVLTAGAKLVGATLSTELTLADTRDLLVDGYFPLISRSALAEKRSSRSGSAIISFGLPYEKEPAITRHVAAFIARHGSPNVLLLNGGVFHAPLLVARIAEQVAVCTGAEPFILTNDAPDLAVARGAVAYGHALERRSKKEKLAVPIIGGGSARGYYIGVDATHAICVLPRGAEEAAAYVAEGRAFALTIGKPARFELYASADASDAAGQIVDLDFDRFEKLPNVTARLGDAGRTRELRVAVRAELTAVGTLDLSCVEIAGENRSFRLSFQLRDGDAEQPRSSTRPPPSANSSALIDAKKLITLAFETGSERAVKDLLRDLERRLGERSVWSIDLARSLFDVLAQFQASRRRSADHERIFWLLSGYCVRPGFGFAGDEDRAHLFARLFAEKVTFADNPRVWQQFFIAMRRASGGIDDRAQLEMRDAFDPLLAPADANLKKSKKWKPLSLDDLLETAASLERVPPSRRVELGNWLIERTWTDRDPRIWSAIGKIGARVPSYASVHHVVSPQTAEKWLDHLLREKWETLQTAELSATRLARMTGDRARDVSAKVRSEVENRLTKIDARPESIRAVRELVDVDATERATFFGETLPIGLRLL